MITQNQTKATATMTCPACDAPLRGVLVPPVLDADDIVAHFGGKITRHTVLEWFRERTLSGFKPAGSRDWLILVDDYLADIERMKRSTHGPRALKPGSQIQIGAGR
jgi:hypothetical protein